MKLSKLMVFLALIFFFFMGCASPTSGTRALHWSDTDTQAEATNRSGSSNSQVSPNFTGSGGSGITLAILAPQATGLAGSQSYLPILVQGEFVSNFSGYSAIQVLDRVRLDEQYTELLSGYYSDNSQAGTDLGHLTPTDYIMGGSIVRTSTGYALQMHITRTNDKFNRASYSGTFNFAELDNLTGIRRASLDLLEKMDVMLTETARRELSGAAAANHVTAQTSLAQGISAQQRGTVVEALNHYYNAVAFDPRLPEANTRLSVLSSSVSRGNIGETVRNDIQRRNEWMKILLEAEEYFYNHLPYDLIYSSSLTTGSIDYSRETVELSSTITLKPNSGFNVFGDIMAGLERTEKRGEWGLASWPISAAGSRGIFTGKLDRYSRYDGSKNVDVSISLLNDRGRTISTAKITLESNLQYILRGPRRIGLEATETQGIFRFTVNANDITDSMTIKIVSVNGIDVERNPDYINISVTHPEYLRYKPE
jgi:hypothetical protein